MLYYLDYVLDRVTMYRLVVYYLLALLGIALLLSFSGLLNYNPVAIVFTTTFLVIIGYGTNKIFSFIFEAPANSESVYITALILACIITPISDIHNLPFLFWVGVLAQASKYIIAIRRKHIFNPVAIAVVLVALGLGQSASWWIGNTLMMPFIVIGGLLVVRKTRQEYMVLSFYISALGLITLFAIGNATPLVTTYRQVLASSSFFFFAYVMLTEPFTSPTTRSMQLIYGFFVGLLFPPQVHIGSIYSTPELALCAGNLMTFFINPQQRLVLRLKEKIQLAPDVYDFIFQPERHIAYLPGQYLEWTYPHPNTDSRGNRRYFTLASSPTEETLRIGVKFYTSGSSFKKNLEMAQNEVICAGQLAGDFILPKDTTKKLVFVAGGIGITPFRSMLKFLIDRRERRDIVVIYSNKSVEDILYQEILSQAHNDLGIRTIFTLTDMEHLPPGWNGEVGRVNGAMISSQIPDWKERMFYISGSHTMVVGFEKALRAMGVSISQIKKDFFPGLV